MASVGHAAGRGASTATAPADNSHRASDKRLTWLSATLCNKDAEWK